MLKQVFYFVLLFLSRTFCCDDKEKEMIFELPETSMARTEPVVTTETSNLDHELKMTTVSDINTPIDDLIHLELNPRTITNDLGCEIVIKDKVHHSPEIILEPIIKPNKHSQKNQEGITFASKTQDSSKLEIEFEIQKQGINVQPFTRTPNCNSMDCGTSVPNDAVSRSVLSEPMEKVIEMVKNDLEPLDKGLIIEFPDKKLLVEKVTFVNSTTKDLTDLIESLNTELSNVTKFYSYYDILSYIDKSIALINRFFLNPNTEISKYSAICTKKITEITTEIENAKKFLEKIKEQFLEEDARNYKKCNFKNAENKLLELDKHIECLEKQFNRYKVIQIENEYKRYDEMKLKHLDTLQKHLETIREKTYPMNEEEIQKYDNLFKNNFFTVISEVHKNLISCYVKEQNSLKWLFEIFDGILEDIRNCIEQLKSFESILI
ncbi:hypothetical protein NBO_172g0001 [Nosema bombycis CQ1]|uniref:Uncharacterized protein n=1 Tax=Nosema bombycis (strain CQ1 / CVCC 102059) TaxID=578461 RepID=R0M535_NOSB1|nr:hypothetical protein NBO_172g0001 [Nosema bombycis CQ1]|eukprot:EOB13119.1 hypothetical protein NBO_172g0001 [Nosema bombycis CQ1]